MFGGTRDVDWTHIRVDGDRAAAAAYVPTARLLLGAAKQTFESTGVSQPFRRRFNNGAEIIATYNAETPIVTIRVPETTGRRPKPPLFDGFYLQPTYESLLGGFDSPGVVVNADSEAAFFFEPYQPYWARIKGAKFTYKERDGVPLFPDGMLTLTNRYWQSPAGVVISWRSPCRDHGYLEHTVPVRFTIAQGSTWGYNVAGRTSSRWRTPTVGNLGLPLFSPDRYRDEEGNVVGSDPFSGVAGAAVDGTRLYVAQYARDAGGNTREDGGVRIARYQLRSRDTKQPFLAAVVDGSREWVTDPIELEDAWELVTDVQFNASCTEALLVLRSSITGFSLSAGDVPTWVNGPHLRLKRVDLATGAQSDSSTSGAFSVTGDFTSGSIAFDCFHTYRGDDLVAYRFTISGSFANIQAKLTTPSGADIDLYHIIDRGTFKAAGAPVGAGTFYAKYVAKTVHYVDARNGYVVLCGVDNTNAPTSYSTWIEVWREQLDAGSPAIAKVYESERFTVPCNPFPAVEPLGSSPRVTLSNVWNGFDSLGLGFYMGGANPNLGLFSWSLVRRCFTEPFGRIPYDLNTGYQWGLSSDAVTGVFMRWNVFNTAVSDTDPTSAPSLAGVGYATAHRNAHTLFCAYKDTWVLFTYVPGTSDRRLVISSDGTSVRAQLGADENEEVASSIAIPFGRPIFNPST